MIQRQISLGYNRLFNNAEITSDNVLSMFIKYLDAFWIQFC